MGILKFLGKILGKQAVKNQTLVHYHSADGVYVNVSFKRAGNVVECSVSSKLKEGSSGILSGADFDGVVPTWAYPDRAITKQKQIYESLDRTDVRAYMMAQLSATGGITIMYGVNSSETGVSDYMQFTYIVDDTDAVYEKGDVDGNGVIDETDLNLLMSNFTVGIPLTKKSKAAGDMNSDGSITNADITALMRKIGQ